jgi:prepilin-type N-terminal cleavage/methylation domain-containing protein
MYNNRFRGFTLIELLVVIAIIGILSAVVLASLNTARNKGSDAAVQSDLSAIQVQAEVFYSTGNTYTSVCADTTIVKALAGADSANGAGAAPTCASTATTYIAYAQLLADNTKYWCIDSTGISKIESAAPGAVAACP